jgi:PRMT5 arginine-N-methyltransferase
MQRAFTERWYLQSYTPSLHGLTFHSTARTKRSLSPRDHTQNIPIGSESQDVTGLFSWAHRSRQTVFYTPDTLRISDGEKIKGKLTCSPNSRNNRDLDITISYSTPNSERTQVDYKMCALGPRFEGYADQMQVVINRICTILHSTVIVSSRASFFATTGIDIQLTIMYRDQR